jgi:hypothetical protein
MEQAGLAGGVSVPRCVSPRVRCGHWCGGARVLAIVFFLLVELSLRQIVEKETAYFITTFLWQTRTRVRPMAQINSGTRRTRPSAQAPGYVYRWHVA